MDIIYATRGNDCFPQSRRRRILFAGPATVKTVRHYTHQAVEAEVTPLIVVQECKNDWGEDEVRWGLIYQCIPLTVLGETRNEGEEATDPLTPFELDDTFVAWANPVRWWRALQLLEAIPILDHYTTHLQLWIATGHPRRRGSSDIDIIERLCSTFTEGSSYEEIMARPIPLEIVQLTVQLVDEGLDMHGVEYDLTDEIEAGTIRWSQDLKRIGVIHPEYRRAMLTARAIVVKRYRDHLFSYAAFRGCSYDDEPDRRAFIMVCIETCLCRAIERGIEQQYGMDITAMLCILREEIMHDDVMENLLEKHPHYRESSGPYTRPDPEEHFARVIAWMTEHFTQAGLVPQKEELNQLLHKLYKQFETMPVTHLLVS